MSLSSPSWMQIPGLVKQLMLLKVSCQNRAHNEGTESPTSSGGRVLAIRNQRHFSEYTRRLRHSLNIRQRPNATQTKAFRLGIWRGRWKRACPRVFAAGVAKSSGIRHLTDAYAIKNNQTHTVENHRSQPISQVFKQIGKSAQHGHLIRRAKILPLAVPCPGVRNIECPNARGDGWIDVRSRTVSNHPGVRLGKRCRTITS